MIRNVGESPPRPVPQQGRRDDHLKPTGFSCLTTRRHAFCPFRNKPCFPENGLQPFRVRVVVTDDQDSSPIRDFQCQARMSLALGSTFSSLRYRAHGFSFLCSRARPNPDLSPLLSETVPIAWEPLWFKRPLIEPGTGYVVTGRRQSHSALPRNVSTPPRLPG